MKNLFKLGLVALMGVCALGFSRAEEAGDPETLTVTPAGTNTVAENGKVTFNGVATFKMKVDGKVDADSNYGIQVEILSTDITVIEPIATLNYDVTDTVATFVGLYNGEYTVAFELKHRNVGANVWSTVKEAQEFEIEVTNYTEPARPNLTFDVKPAGNTVSEDEKIVFADGNTAFDILVKGVPAGDTNYIVAVSIWTMDQVAAGEGPQEEYVKINADSIRYNGGMFYNDVYEAAFELRVYNLLRGEYMSVDDKEAIKINFSVTENEAPAADPTIRVVAVGATQDGENLVFAPGEVAFDMFLEGMETIDTNYCFAAAICTKAQYEDTNEVVLKVIKIADSARVKETLTEGEYVGLFELRRPADTIGREEGKMTVVDGATIFFTVGHVANERVELAGVNVYPNPNAGTFNVAVPERARVEIFGLNGAKMMSREVNAGVETFSIDHSGIYFVRVMAGNKTAVKRVVVR